MAQQTWEQIYFLHWRVNESELRPYIPKPLVIDTFDGSAWITIVCFLAKNSRLRYVPINFISKAIQTNVRTYVKLDGKQERGVYFFNLFVNNKLAVLGAQSTFALPFKYVHSMFEYNGDLATYKTYKHDELIFNAQFERTNKKPHSSELARFLTERYCIWNDKKNRMIKVPIIHSKWNVNEANVTIEKNILHPCLRNGQPNAVHYFNRKVTKLFPYESVLIFK